MTDIKQPNLPGAAIVAIAVALLLLPWLGETLFYSKGEPREAVVAMTMLESGNWILPVSYGGDLPYKPPFLAWLIACFAALFNGGAVNEYISRLPSALAAFAMIMGGYAWARSERGERFAVLFSFVTIGSFEVFRAALACRVDMVLTACMVGAIYLLYHIREHNPRRRGLLYVAAVLLLSCAMMTKGPVGTLLPCLVAGVYLLLRRDRFFPTFFRMTAIAVASMIIPALWYYAAWLQGGQQFFDLVMEENIGRLSGTMSYESHLNPWWYNIVTLVAGLLPWTLLLLASLPAVRRISRRPLSTAALLSVTAAVLVVGFYTIPASKRSVYLLPAYPFICYGIAMLLDVRSGSGAVRFFAWLTAVLAVAAPVALVALQILPLRGLTLEPIPWWRHIILLIPVAVGLAWFAGRRHSPSGHICAAVWALYLGYVAVGMPSVLNPRSEKAAAQRLAEMSTSEYIYSIGPQRFYSLNYYLGDRMRHLGGCDEALALPAGSLLVFQTTDVDTAPLDSAYTFDLLLRRGADHRRPVAVGVKNE